MKQRIAILYATRHGHTRRIAEHLAVCFRKHGIDTDVWPVIDVPDGFDVARYAAVVVAASAHVGRHEPEIVRFVKRNAAPLSRTINALISVTLSRASAERAGATPAVRERAAADVVRMLRQFVDETGWEPQRMHPAAGALLYTKYGWWLRLLMKWIAKRVGGATDTTRDHVYTDWRALDDLARDIVAEIDATRDWVVAYFHNTDHQERQCRIVTERIGPLAGRRVVRAREDQCRLHYARLSATQAAEERQRKREAVDDRLSARDARGRIG